MKMVNTPILFQLLKQINAIFIECLTWIIFKGNYPGLSESLVYQKTNAPSYIYPVEGLLVLINPDPDQCILVYPGLSSIRVYSCLSWSIRVSGLSFYGGLFVSIRVSPGLSWSILVNTQLSMDYHCRDAILGLMSFWSQFARSDMCVWTKPSTLRTCYIPHCWSLLVFYSD